MPWIRLGATALEGETRVSSALALDAGVRLAGGLRVGTRWEWTGSSALSGGRTQELIGLGVGGWWSPDVALSPWVGVRAVASQPRGDAAGGSLAHVAAEGGLAWKATDSLALLLTVEARAPLGADLSGPAAPRTTGAGASLRWDF